MIPLNRPPLGVAEASAASRAILSGDVIGRGNAGLALERKMASDIKAGRVLLTTSGTHALELAMAALGIGPGDEVILPSFTFPSAANCVLRQKATPVFADVLPETLNLDPRDAARRVTRRTKAILPVHYAGVASDMGALLSLARRGDLFMVEDAAHAVGASWEGKALGAIGDAGCWSFHATKNITCGEGGALITRSSVIARKAELFREKGTNRSAFIRGEVKKYTWVSEGSSYVLSDILTAVLAEQWKRRLSINTLRGARYRAYLDGLGDLERRNLLRLPVIPKGCRSSYHLFHILLPNKATRLRLTAHLRGKGIGATFHYQALHDSPYARRVLGWREALPVSEMATDCLLRLPLYSELSLKDVAFICEEIRRCLS